VSKVRNEAGRLFSRNLHTEDRVLITGASGWFGRTALAMTKLAGLDYLATGSKARVMTFDGDRERIELHGLDVISAFKPTVVIDAAFLTREKAAVVGADKYIDANRKLIRCSKEIASLDSVRKYVGFSSGAAVHLAGYSSFDLLDNPYAALKRDYEEEMLALSESTNASIVIPRVWSVTGAYVNSPKIYAFSSFILQAKSGNIEIRARHNVLRRYSLVEDVVSLAISQPKEDRGTVFDTGGEILEIGRLAEEILLIIDPAGKITRDIEPELPADHYYSDNSQWSNISLLHGLGQAPISQQIRLVSRHIP